MDQQQPVVDIQPASIQIALPNSLDSHHATADQADGVHIRPMVREDCAFVSRMSVNSFRDKFEFALGKEKANKYIDINTTTLENSPDVYARNLVAICDGRPAGVCSIKIKNDPKENDEDCSNLCSTLGCYRTCRLVWMACILETNVSSSSQCYIDYICVDSDFRGKGIGGKLLARADEEAKKSGCKTMMLYVVQSNRAKNLYERNGYHVTDSEKGSCIAWSAVGESDFYKMEKNLY